MALMQRLRVAREGNLVVEFALAVPVLLAIFIGIIDFGSAIYNLLSLRSAARSGAEFAVIRPTDYAGIEAMVRASTDFGDGEVDVAAEGFCECPNGSAVACTGTCTGTIREYVRVTVTQPFTPMIPYGQYLFPSEISSQAIVRVR